MKKIKTLILSIILLFECCQTIQDENKSTKDIVNDTSSKVYSTETSSTPDQIKSNATRNSRDQKGLKQGIWDYIENGQLKGYETFLNDTLNGDFRKWINYPSQILTGQYWKGLKSGICKYLDDDTNLVMVVKYEKNLKVWVGFPYADSNFHTPIKGFQIVPDNVFIECPYSNDTIWYTGKFVNKKPIGIHKMYHPNGNLKYEHNYSNSKIKVYDKQGNFIEEKEDDIRKGWNSKGV